ncbi:hypothetical protein J4E85_001125 [Alternaria conjuncta]|uniref:uncharacterized protein n=1 Tax=Alternaria conjuncta TaxID=181017 RepID=UPI00221EB5EA|nr:uncharacterized protein J4E85_001125 [Alternaria conjuncta]KAI4935799.1 hypothetical protein J4E85_001125 [Alternaria conjuncta]
MFTAHDVKDIFALFPPQDTSDFVPRLALSSSGHAFVTLQFVQARFRSRVTKETQRIPVSTLANDLDIGRLLVHQLVHSHPKLCLFSADEESIIPIDERDTIVTRLSSGGLASKAEFIAQHRVSSKSLDFLLSSQDYNVLETNGYIYTKAYAHKIADIVKSMIQKTVDDVRTLNIKPADLPDNPPTWFILHTLERLLQSENLTSKVNIQETDVSVLCTPKRYLESERDTTVYDLQSGALAYLDVQRFASDFIELFPSSQVALSYFQQLSGIEVIDSFAVSLIWISRLEQDCVRILEQEGCTLDVTEVIGSRLPPTIREQVAGRAKNSIVAHFSETTGGLKIVRVGTLILTERRRDGALDELAGYAKEAAKAQWQSLHDDPTLVEDVKFTRDKIKDMIPPTGLVQRLLLQQKPVEKLLEERFWFHVSSFETLNEEDFAMYWTDRMLTRYRIYSAGLVSVMDQKVHSQLAQVFATYAHKDLIPDTIAKARAQGLVLSRKTRKNVTKLSSVLESTTPLDNTSLSSALEKFNKKQGINHPSTDSLAAAKQSMLDDMLRRIKKQKASDGPVLFLTLVILLFAKQYDGVVYATGKFTPKLLKLLKGKLEYEQYEQLERWKEAAKTNTLSAEDREGMARMAAT